MQRRIMALKRPNGPAERLPACCRRNEMSEKIYDVPAEWKSRAFVDDAKYQEMYARSLHDPKGFWAGEAKRLDWYKALGLTGPETLRIMKRARIHLLVLGIVDKSAALPLGRHVVDLLGHLIPPAARGQPFGRPIWSFHPLCAVALTWNKASIVTLWSGSPLP